MSTPTKETIANRLTIQTGLMGIIIALWTVFTTYVAGSSFNIPIEQWFGPCIITLLLMLFIRDDKRQEHSTAAATLTNPNILEQNLDRQAKIFEAQAQVFKDACEALSISQGTTVVEKIIEKEVPVEKIVYVPINSDMFDSNTTG